jgi:hypothetical protein
MSIKKIFCEQSERSFARKLCFLARTKGWMPRGGKVFLTIGFSTGESYPQAVEILFSTKLPTPAAYSAQLGWRGGGHG